jgi:hypothetical protein
VYPLNAISFPGLRHVVRLICLTCLALLTWQPLAARAATVEVQVVPENGLPVVMLGGVPVATFQYVYWGKNWAWAGQTQKSDLTAPLSYRVSGKVANLGLTLEAQTQRAATPDRLALAWRYQAAADMAEVIGGGLSVRFNLRAAQELMGEPELLADGKGWAWGRAGSVGRVEMRLAAKPAALYFEAGRKGEIRIMFYGGQVKAGPLEQGAEILTSQGARLSPHMREKLAAPDASWKPVTLPFEQLGLPDLSYLNAADKPAGKRGYVKAVGDQLQFPDGSPARFWGTNLTAYSLYSTARQDVPVQARRLAAQGYNLVRLHHHDSIWVSPNIFGTRKTGDIDETQAARIDWWIKCLKDEGIYVWLDLHVGRHFSAADQIDALDELTKGKPTGEGKGYNYVNPSIQQAMKRFAERYLTRVSSETGLRAIDDPAVAFVALTNENDLTNHFGNALLPDKKVPWHNAGYTAAARQFAEKNGLDREKTWRSWEAGPSKIFLNDLERRFADDQIRHLKALGLKALVSTTSTWGDNPIFSLPALTVGDVVDVHSYGGEGWMGIDPLIAPNLLHWLQAGKVPGKPSTVSEWNLDGGLAIDRHTLPLYMAANAAHQGVAALMHYAYTQGPFAKSGGTGPYEAHADPALAYVMPLAALAYRSRLVAPARQSVVYAPSADEFFNRAATPHDAALRTHGEISRLAVAMPAHPALPWLQASRLDTTVQRLTVPTATGLPANASSVRSDTGELMRDWTRRIATIDTPRLQAAMGEVGGHDIKLADLQVRLSNPLATAVAVSLDDQPLARSADWALVVTGRALPQAGKQPYVMEPVAGVVQFRLTRPMTASIISSDGETAQGELAPSAAQQGWLALDLGTFKGKGALVLRLRKPAPGQKHGN